MKIKKLELIILLSFLALFTRQVASAQSYEYDASPRDVAAQTGATPSTNRGGATLGASVPEGKQDAIDYFKQGEDSADVFPYPAVELDDNIDENVDDEVVGSQDGSQSPDFGGRRYNASGNVAADDVQPLDEPGRELQNMDPASWFNAEKGWFGREGMGSLVKTILVTSVLVVAPAILLMTTSYVRISVVLLLLRQALGIGQIPSNQVIAALSVFLTFLVMSPVGKEVYQKAALPYSEGKISRMEAFNSGQEPVRTFLWKQIENTGNTDTIGVFTKYLPDEEEPLFYEDVPWRALAPAFLLSELKTAFLIGFQIFLPFLVVDLVVSCVLVSTGMMMLPPAIVSLPFKLALFVMVDGWSLVVKSLLESFT